MPYEYFWYAPTGELIEHQQQGNAGFNTPFQFSARTYDAIPELVYMGARYYSPQFSIFTSPDPMRAYRSWISPYNYVQNNPIMRQDPTGMLDGGVLEEGIPGGTLSSESEPHNTNTSKALNNFFSGVKDFFKKSWNWIKGDGFFIYDADEDYAQWMDDNHANLEEVEVGAQECSDCDNAMYIFGNGSNGVESWNEGLKPGTYADMNDPFWSPFLSWGQKGLFKDGLGTLSEKIISVVKAVTDAISIVLSFSEDEEKLQEMHLRKNLLSLKRLN